MIALAYAQSGVSRLERLLTGNGVLACTSATGLLPLCDQAATTWRKIDDHGGQLSSLARASIHAIVSSMITAILAGSGKSRWCEISFSAPRCAETFLQLYPTARVLCMHRSCPDVIRAGIKANPWSLTGTAFANFSAGYPTSSAATIAAYWVSCTEALLELEEAYPAACRRVRHEDLVGDPDREADEIFSFLRLARAGSVHPALLSHELPLARDDSGSLSGEATVPADELPPLLRARVNDLQARIGYPPIT